LNAPHYGCLTIMRPLLSNVLEGRPGWALVDCPYCGRPCWKIHLEPAIMPADTTAACTECALRRGRHQREMDAARYARELRS
jgi:hypothetical protein